MRRRGLLPLVFIVLVAGGALAATLITDTRPQLGLDLQGGASVVLEAQGDPGDESLDQAVEIIRSRVDALGVAEPEIARQGDNVVVELPGVDNQQRALELVGETAELEFRPVCTLLPPFGAELPEDATSTTAPADGETTTTAPAEATSTTAGGDEQGFGPVGGEGELAAAQGETTTTGVGEGGDTTTTTAPAAAGATEGQVDPATGTPCPAVPESVPEQNLCEEPQEGVEVDGFAVLAECDDDGNEVARYLVGPTALTGSSLEGADAVLAGTEWAVNPTFQSGEEGIDAFNAVAARCFSGDPSCPAVTGQVGSLAIVLDDQVVSAPAIQTPTFTRDEIQISGAFDESSAKDLATVLRYGALPVELETQAVQTISATLGEDSLRAGLLAGLVGVVAVCLYMVLYYRALGLVVVFGLGVWGALIWGIVCYLSANAGLALTLAGVTGLVVSVGVTVDSYVVYFERLKDDVHKGKSLRSSTGKSFNRAFRTILTADVSSFMGAAILYWLTIGPVRGFALFLGIATILDVVVAWFFTRPLVGLLGRSRLFTEARFIGVARGLRRREDQEAVDALAGAGAGEGSSGGGVA